MIKKIGVIILALVLCLSAVVIPVSAYDLASDSEIAYEIKLDKDNYNAGDTVTISLYLYAKSGYELGTGAIIFGVNSALFSMDDNADADVKASAVGSELNESYYKAASESTWAWQTKSAILTNISANNTAEENAMFDQYMKYTIARNTSGTHDNAGSNKNGLPADEINADSEAGVAFVSFQLKLRDDIEDGTVINVGIPTGAMPKNYCYMNYYKDPGNLTTVVKTTKDTSEIVNSTTATVGDISEECAHEKTTTTENVVEAATCAVDGSKTVTVTCDRCGAVISEDTVVVPATGAHVYAKEIERVEPTCTTDGYVVKACGCSDEEKEQTTLPATGHTETKAITRPTCTEKGYTTYTCSVCNNVRTDDEVEAKGHNYKSKVTTPTCTEGGFTTYTCPACKDVYVADEVPATGHSYNSVVTPPTCTEGGYTTDTCSVCGDVQTKDEVAATGHDYEVTFEKAPSCSADGYTQYTCSVCDDYYRDPVPSTNHTNADGTSALVEVPAIEPTCSTSGRTAGEQCSICNGWTVPTSTIPAIDHTWVASEVVAPTYNAEGYTVYTCSMCNDTKKDDYTDKKPALNVEIEAPASTEVAEGETVTLKAPIGEAAEGLTVVWSANNENFTLTQNADGSVTLTPVANGTTEITVTVYENGAEVSKDTIQMTAIVENDDEDDLPWWKVLLNWIIELFKKLVEIIKGLVSSLVG